MINEQDKLKELESYKARLESDLNRTRMMSGIVPTRDNLLVKNYHNVVQEINKIKKG